MSGLARKKPLEMLSTDDGFEKVRATIDQLVREIKDKYSMELAEKLFGGRLPE